MRSLRKMPSNIKKSVRKLKNRNEEKLNSQALVYMAMDEGTVNGDEDTCSLMSNEPQGVFT